MQDHPTVIGACSVGIPDPRVGERIKAMQVGAQGRRKRRREQRADEVVQGPAHVLQDTPLYRVPRYAAEIEGGQALEKRDQGRGKKEARQREAKSNVKSFTGKGLPGCPRSSFRKTLRLFQDGVGERIDGQLPACASRGFFAVDLDRAGRVRFTSGKPCRLTSSCICIVLKKGRIASTAPAMTASISA